jgi:hypothetical protein
MRSNPKGSAMKKNLSKLRLHRETLAQLDAPHLAVVGRAAQAIVTSCTYPCGCETGCSDAEACLGTDQTQAGLG